MSLSTKSHIIFWVIIIITALIIPLTFSQYNEFESFKKSKVFKLKILEYDKESFSSDSPSFVTFSHKDKTFRKQLGGEIGYYSKMENDFIEMHYNEEDNKIWYIGEKVEETLIFRGVLLLFGLTVSFIYLLLLVFSANP